MIREALDRMALGERAVLAGVEVERVSLFGWRMGGIIVDATEGESVLVEAADGWRGVRCHEKLRAGDPAADTRIAELRRQHGRALRVTGQARAKRARWTGKEVWLVVSYPKEA